VRTDNSHGKERTVNNPPYFDDVTKRAYESAMKLLRERFEEVPVTERLPYHSCMHTQGVVERAMKIAEVLDLSWRERVLLFVASVFHDTVQESEMHLEEDGCVRRIRFSGMNELMSAMDAISFMRSDPYGFSAYEDAVVSHAIIGTTASWSTEYETVTQSLVNEKSHIVSRVLALADLGEAGMDSEAFLRSGYTLFAEDNVGIVTHITRVNDPNDIPLEVRKLYRSRLLSWLSGQVAFAKGRKELLMKELVGFKDLRWVIKRELFNQFDASRSGAVRAYEDARALDFVTLMRRLHPDAFPGMET
jgi:hypothetical protein